MKSWRDKLADKAYLFKKRLFPDHLAHISQVDKYPFIPAKQFRPKLHWILNNLFSAAGYSEYKTQMWFRQRSALFVESLTVSNIENLLPTYFRIEPHAALHSPVISRLLEVLSDRKYDKMHRLFSVRLVNLFPRDEKVIGRQFTLSYFSSENAVDSAITETGKRILERSNQFFNQFKTYEDVIYVFENSHFPWEKKRGHFVSLEQDEMLGVLYLITDQTDKALSLFEKMLIEKVKPMYKANVDKRLLVAKRAIDAIKSGEIVTLIENASRKANLELDGA